MDIICNVDILKLIGANIKRLRRRKGLTQEGLAVKSGLTIMTISRYENGTQPPRQKNLKDVARALDCEASDLYSIDDSMIYERSAKILARLCELSPRHREYVLAVLFVDSRLVPKPSRLLEKLLTEIKTKLF